jgi:hypothetical protein
MPKGLGTGCSWTSPSGVTLPSSIPVRNQILPSGPTVIPRAGVGTERIGISNVVTAPSVVIRPIRWLLVNQRAPSGPVTIPPTPVMPEGSGNSVKSPVGVIRPIAGGSDAVAVCSKNQRLPSGPSVIAPGRPGASGRGNSVSVPSIVHRPIALCEVRENHKAPSGPGVIDPGVAGSGNSVKRADESGTVKRWAGAATLGLRSRTTRMTRPTVMVVLRMPP